jgi:hypothetical protein
LDHHSYASPGMLVGHWSSCLRAFII